MINKHVLFSYALLSVFFCLAITSAFINNQIFNDIASVVTLPMILFAIGNIASTVFDKVGRELQKNMFFFEQRLPDVKELLGWDDLRKGCAADSDDDEFKNETRQKYEERNEQVDAFETLLKEHSNVMLRLQGKPRFVISIFYVTSLAFLLLCAVLSQMLVDIFTFGSLPTFTFIALLIAVANGLLSDHVSSKLVGYMISKESKRIRSEERTE